MCLAAIPRQAARESRRDTRGEIHGRKYRIALGEMFADRKYQTLSPGVCMSCHEITPRARPASLSRAPDLTPNRKLTIKDTRTSALKRRGVVLADPFNIQCSFDGMVLYKYGYTGLGGTIKALPTQKR